MIITFSEKLAGILAAVIFLGICIFALSKHNEVIWLKERLNKMEEFRRGRGKNMLTYKGYYTCIEKEKKALCGKLEGITDLITFEAENLNQFEIEFHNAVEDYLQMCKEIGKEPEYPD